MRPLIFSVFLLLFFPEEYCICIALILWRGNAGLMGGNSVRTMSLCILLPDVGNLAGSVRLYVMSVEKDLFRKSQETSINHAEILTTWSACHVSEARWWQYDPRMSFFWWRFSVLISYLVTWSHFLIPLPFVTLVLTCPVFILISFLFFNLLQNGIWLSDWSFYFQQLVYCSGTVTLKYLSKLPISSFSRPVSVLHSLIFFKK